MRLSDVVAQGLIGVALFVSTNLDDLFVVMLLFASGRFRSRDVVAGQLLGMTGLTLASIAVASALVMLPESVIELLGLAPIGLGLLILYRSGKAPEGLDETSRVGAGIVPIAMVAVANGSDNLAAYIPVFATRNRQAIVVIGLAFGMLTVLWCWLAKYLVEHPKVGPPLRRYGGKLLPWVLVGIGVEVLWSHFVSG